MAIIFPTNKNVCFILSQLKIFKKNLTNFDKNWNTKIKKNLKLVDLRTKKRIKMAANE